MHKPTPKSAIPAALIERLRTGPASLNSRSPFNLTRANPEAEALRAELFKDYTLWLETWVVPELERMQLKKGRP